MHSNNIINSLWVGKDLSPLELLTLHSFISKGYTFYLWVYESLNNRLPPGVILKDANSIIPKEKIFKRKKAVTWKGFGKGSLALFADLFRFKLLHLHGGWWVDMDITCLKTLDSQTDYFFRSHPYLPMIGNLMKCPQGSLLMQNVYKEALKKCTNNTADWLLSNKILNKHVELLNLDKFIFPDISNNDDWLQIANILYLEKKPEPHWHYVHWMNEEWRSRGMNKYQVIKNSFLHQLYQQYKIEVEPIPNRNLNIATAHLRIANRKVRTLVKSLIS